MIVVYDMFFGDGGKGRVTSLLSHYLGAHMNYRFNGGPQAAHHVVDDDGVVHCFAQAGSGSFNPRVITYLSRFMLIEPFAMINEYEALTGKGIPNIWNRIFIEDKSVVITPFHIMTNRIREIARGGAAHGSCGMGVWEARSFALDHPDEALVAGDFKYSQYMRSKLHYIYEQQWKKVRPILKSIKNRGDVPDAYREVFSDWESVIDHMMATYTKLSDRVNIVEKDWFKSEISKGVAIGEGAQGVLLSDLQGFHPHTSATDTTLKNAETLINEARYRESVIKVAVMRWNLTRHGNGTFVTEDQELTQLLPELHNPTGRWQGSMRVGYMDLVMMNYSFDISGKPDALAVTCLDRMDQIPEWKIATQYEYDGNPLDLNGYCEHDGGRVLKLNAFWSQNEALQLSHQETLTRILSRCTPVYEVINHDVDQYLAVLEEASGIPIALTSHGVGPTDMKMLREDIFKIL